MQSEGQGAILLPEPMHVEKRAGVFHSGTQTRILLAPDASAADHVAASQVQQELARSTGVHAPVQRVTQDGDDPAAGAIVLRLGAHGRGAATEVPQGREAYSLSILPDGIVLSANASPGLARGAQTLRQLIQQQPQALQAMAIQDQPQLGWRGQILDVTRGKVPTLKTLFQVVDVLAYFKLNMLQLHVEHVFHFPRHPKIGAGWDGLTSEDIVALDRYCAERHVELIPCLQSFGHLRHILLLPEYAHLAELADEPWSLSPVKEETYRFLEELYADFLPSFSSQYFNVCCDETHDIGKGTSAELAARVGVGRVYLQHILRLHELVGRFGRTMMMWGDIVLRHPDLISELPKDIVVLNWRYEAETSYPSTERFADAGLRQVVCPGISSWNTLFPRVANAEANMRVLVHDGVRSGAEGMLNTDWGDGGHPNPLGASWWGYAFGAEQAWSGGRPEDAAIDRAFSCLFYGEAGAQVRPAISALGEAASLVMVPNGSLTRSMFFRDPLSERIAAVPAETLQRMSVLAESALEALGPARDAPDFQGAAFPSEARGSVGEIRTVARQIRHAAQKVLLVRRCAAALEQGQKQAYLDLARDLARLKRDLHRLRADFVQSWLARNHWGGIWIALDEFDRAARFYDQIADRLGLGLGSLP